mmetsp:Transcript_111271/g.197033  ORF Transcript_111271/g.197033 Transcript_111271/m.197033 type:complete len:1218 (-) Transcript_111271:222-3875(-)
MAKPGTAKEMGATSNDKKDSETASRTSGASTKSKLSDLSGLKLGTLNLDALESASVQKNLQALDLKDNKIAALPAEVYHAFTQVKVLDLRKNALEEILPDLSVMTNLEDLLLDQNRLQEIPSEVCGLPKLKTLSLNQNVLTKLPKTIGDMNNLRSISLGDNHVAELPTELGKCSELQAMYLHHNHFTKLPTSLHQLENLSELALEWFRYTTPPLPRVIKGTEWKRIITKFVSICKEKFDKGDTNVTCIEVLSLFSQKPFDANAIDSKKRTRLHVACLEGHVGVAISLAENGSRCDSEDCEGYSPLLVAVREEHPAIATTLVRVGVDVNRGGGLFGSPLHVATVNFDPHMVLLLIRGKADVNKTDADGNTPLHVLMSVFDKGGKRAGSIGQILLRHNADCNMMNSDKWAPLHLAARRGQLRGICFVLSHIDTCDAACLKGTCSHQPAHKKSKSSRVRTCPKVFDLNLRGGSHLWTPCHLAGHACHVPVVQILIESGADVFLRNIDGRTARHVSRGNLAISKLLRKAEDEWLWNRINQAGLEGKLDGDGSRQPSGSPRTDDNLCLPCEAEEDDPIEAIAGIIEGSGTTTADIDEGGDEDNISNIGDKRRPSDAGGPPAPVPRKRSGSKQKRDRIMEKCCDTHFTKAELQALQAANFSIAPSSIEEFVNMLAKLTQQGPRHRLPFLLSKPWVKQWKDFLAKLLEDEGCQNTLLHSSLVTNEDFIRMLFSDAPREELPRFGGIRNKEQENMLHVLCKCSTTRAYPSAATRADILSLLLTICPPETFDLEARDLRGQTALHHAAVSGDIGLVQILLEYGADPNAQEETTGWTPLHFAVAKAHYPLILQFLHHDATNVNQVDKFDWPPLLEACSRLDSRSTSLLVNGGAHLGFRNQHQFDVLKAVDTSKKDLAAKRWMSCLVVSNGFRFEESTVQLNPEDRETLEKERAYFNSRQYQAGSPPFCVPDHLAPRCHSCKVLFSVTVRRYHCRSCGLVLCGDCFKWRGTTIVALDERLKSRQMVAQAPAGVSGLENEDEPLNETRLNAAVEMSIREREGVQGSPKNPQGPPTPATTTAPVMQPGRLAQPARPDPAVNTGAAGAAKTAEAAAPGSPRGSDDSFEDPPLAEELPAVGPPQSVVCPASMSMESSSQVRNLSVRPARSTRPMQGGLSRERNNSMISNTPLVSTGARMVRLCAPCATFFEVGVGETYSMLQRKEALHALGH